MIPLWLQPLTPILNRTTYNGWYQCGNLSVYFRHGSILYRKGTAKAFILNNALTLANCNNTNVCGKGDFTQFLSELEAVVLKSSLPQAFDALYIENVLTSRFCAFWERQGYTRMSPRPGEYDNAVPCFVKLSDRLTHLQTAQPVNR